MGLFIIFVAVPIIEIALFIQVGGLLGLWPTLAIVVLTAFAGTTLLRSQGARVMQDIGRAFNSAEDPSEPMAHGAMILIAGVVLLTPGFFTDTIGLLLMIPAVRTMAFHYIRARVNVQSFTMHSTTTYSDDVVDGQWHEVNPSKGEIDPPNRH